jgi:EpsG family
MLPYWLVFLIPAWMTFKTISSDLVYRNRWPLSWKAMFLVLVAIIGFRKQVGGDWEAYLHYLEEATGSLSEALVLNDPGYMFFNWLSNQVQGDIYFVNIMCALLFSWGLMTFCVKQPRPWLAFTVSVPYLITVVAMGYTRQAVAIGLSMVALVQLSKDKWKTFAFWIILAATFHKSAVVLMPLAMMSGTKNKLLLVLSAILMSIIVYFVFLATAIDGLMQNYVGAEYGSDGAGIRIGMNAIPAALFIFFRERFKGMSLSTRDYKLWTWMSVFAGVLVIILFISPSSTAVDRVALYWIPVQLFVFSRLPDALGKTKRQKQQTIIGIICYSAAILFVWLFFGSYSSLWLPYRFFPLEWLFS